MNFRGHKLTQNKVQKNKKKQYKKDPEKVPTLARINMIQVPKNNRFKKKKKKQVRVGKTQKGSRTHRSRLRS